MIVNEREAVSRAKFWELERRAPPGVPVYQQDPFQNDVWEALDGDKDDFLVYDRCGLLTFHIVLPYSFLHYVYVEAAIRATYNKNICNCTLLGRLITTAIIIIVIIAILILTTTITAVTRISPNISLTQVRMKLFIVLVIITLILSILTTIIIIIIISSSSSSSRTSSLATTVILLG
ncbi:hypothetical protein FQN60_016368 [Etheostoma spectabile]|uniref:Selenoprotein P N-terminal domain-containing protein n=1 Tax=Etheostoma spectabile TaxID=54343 RepID=A0A5J5D497_9PERO|nr:hypothetical protein FQN60_016368 [Etheostoma spectabile]